MIDTLRLMLDVSESGGADLLSTANYLQNVKDGRDRATGIEYASGTLGTFRVTLNKGCIFLEGALPTILFPSNAKILTRRECGMSVEALCDLLHLPMGKARVTRLDCSYHWQMAQPCSEYIERLGELTHFKRVLKTANSLYYDKGTKQLTNTLVFYNKTAEACDKRKPIPDAYQESLLLRYECRWLKNPSKQFGVGELTASDLSEKPTYQMMVRKWSEFYFAISKGRQGALNFDGVADVRKAKDWLLGYLLSHTDATNITEVLQAMRNRNIFSDTKYYSRLKAELRKCMAQASKERENDLIRELDSNVRSVMAYCR